MKPFLNVLFLLFAVNSIGQISNDSISIAYPVIDTVFLPRTADGNSYMSDALIVKSGKLSLFTIHFQGNGIRKSTIYVVDYDGKKIVSKIELKNWRYEYRSWVSNDTLLYLAKGGWFPRIELINLNTGEKIESKFESRYNRPIENNGQAEYFGEKKLYCYENTVFDYSADRQVSMIYNAEIHAIIIFTYIF